MCPVPSRANSLNMSITDCRNVFRSQYFFLGAHIIFSFIVDAQLQFSRSPTFLKFQIAIFNVFSLFIWMYRLAR